MRGFGSFSGLFDYLISKWAFMSFFTVVLFNRIQFFASSRVPLNLSWKIRLIIFLVPTIILVNEILLLFRVIRCQTSPHWTELRYGSSNQDLSTLDFAGANPPLQWLSSVLFFWEDDTTSCRLAKMGGLGDWMPDKVMGSAGITWPLFVTLCLNQFFEQFFCVLRGQMSKAETGMTLFEHSLVFAEAEATVLKNLENKSAITSPLMKVMPHMNRAGLLHLMNVPSEVLAVSLISLLNNLSSNVLAILGIRHKVRLVHTGIWGVAYLIFFSWNLFAPIFSKSTLVSPRVMARFPTVCIAGFVPHLVILLGMLMCAFVYAIALIFNFLALPREGSLGGANFSWRRQIWRAYNNLQANISLASGTPLRVRIEDDFYTTLLKVGFSFLISTSDAAFLNQSVPVRIGTFTWVEELRMDELIRNGELTREGGFFFGDDDMGVAMRLASTDEWSRDSRTVRARSASAFKTGYARERKLRSSEGAVEGNNEGVGRSGIVLLKQQGRWKTSFSFMLNVVRVSLRTLAQIWVFTLSRFQVAYVPDWLQKIAGVREERNVDNFEDQGLNGAGRRSRLEEADGTVPGCEIEGRNGRGGEEGNFGELVFRTENNAIFRFRSCSANIEEELRKCFRENFKIENAAHLDSLVQDSLYGLWKAGGYVNDYDNTEDFVPPQDVEEDVSSVVSSETASENFEGREYRDRSVSEANKSEISRECTERLSSGVEDDTASLLDVNFLADLLYSDNWESRYEAKILASHLRSSGPVTRRGFKKHSIGERISLFTGRRDFREQQMREKSGGDDILALETFIRSRRSNLKSNDSAYEAPYIDKYRTGGNWDDEEDGSVGEGSGGGMECVVCQGGRRNILVWPCGCLSLCDDCRVGLALRNFTQCVCCRTTVSAYSRVYIP